MVAIPGGQFMMGGYFDAEVRVPLHRESVADFAMGRYEVTFDEWDACVRGGGCVSNPAPNDQGWGRGRRPVINVSWNDAQEYVQWLSAHTGQTYRLPSEAEWEYADNAPRDSRHLYQQGRFAPTYEERFSPEAQGTVPVGSYAPNYFGVHDKIGNVSELSDDKILPAANHREEYARVLGLNWYDYEPSGRGFFGSLGVDRQSDWVGFRVARSLTGVNNPNALPTPLSGPLEPPLENGSYVYGGYYVDNGVQSDYAIPCGEYEDAVTLTSDVTLHASRDPAAPIVTTARSGERVNIADCRVHFRPQRGEVLRTDYGFEAGRPVYFLYDNRMEWDTEYFEHNEVIDYVWHQGEIIAVTYEFPADLLRWETENADQRDARAVCWFELEAHGVRGWGQSADIDCYWTR